MKEFDVLAAGYICADVITIGAEMPAPGKLFATDRIYLEIGGSSGNTGIALARLGNSVLIGARIGNDNYQASIKKALDDEGVSVDGLVVDELPTSATKVFINESGERSFIHAVGANKAYNIDDVLEHLHRARHLHLGYFNLLKSMDIPALFQMAQERGQTTSLDTAGNPSRDDIDYLRKCLQYTTIFVPSLEEAIALTGKNDREDIAQEFLMGSVEITGVKLGKDGIYLMNREGETVLEPIIDVKVNSTLAAGDAAYAGLLHAYLAGKSLKECALYANATAALCVQGLSKEEITREGVKELVRKRISP